MKLPTDKRLDTIFGVSDEVEDLPQTEVLSGELVKQEDETDADTEESIAMLKRLAGEGENMLSLLTQIASGSEKARDFEVAAGLMKATAEIAKSIIEEKRKSKMFDEPKEPTTVNNTLVLQSTEDLIRLIHQNTKNG